MLLLISSLPITSVQDWSLQCPSSTIWPFKIHLSQTQPFKMQPQIENEQVTWSPQYNVLATRINKRRAVSLQEVELEWLILNPSHLYWQHVPYNSCTSLTWVLSIIIPMFLDWWLGFELALQNEIHMRPSILNTAYHVLLRTTNWRFIIIIIFILWIAWKRNQWIWQRMGREDL